MTGLLALAPAAIALATATARAQASDTLAVDGYHAGRAAAAAPLVGQYTTVGLLTGFVAGAFAAPLFVATRNPAMLLVAGAPIIWTRSRSTVKAVGGDPPADVLAGIGSRPPSYQHAFRASYRLRLGERRRGEMVRATAIGAAVGFLLTMSMVASTGDT